MPSSLFHLLHVKSLIAALSPAVEVVKSNVVHFVCSLALSVQILLKMDRVDVAK